MITTQAHNFNPLSSISIKYPSNGHQISCRRTAKRAYLHKHEFDSANGQKRIWLKAAVQECKLRFNEVRVLEAVIFLTDPINGRGSPCIGTIREKFQESGGEISYNAVREILHRIQEKGAIRIKFNGKKLSNTYHLVGYQYKLETCSPDSVDNLNNTSLRDNSYYITYDEHVNFLNNSEQKQEQEKAKLPKNTHINVKKLNGTLQESEQEVTRACMARGLGEKETRDICYSMRDKSQMKCPVRYLAGILKNKVESKSMKFELREKPRDYNAEQDRNQKALEIARARLKAEGYEYPSPDLEMSEIDRYDAINAYGQLDIANWTASTLGRELQVSDILGNPL